MVISKTNKTTAGWVLVVQKAIETLPENLPFPRTQQFLSALSNGEWNSTSWIESQLKDREFEDINVKIDTKDISLSVSEFVEMTMIMLPMITRYFWTEKQREEGGDKVRPALVKYLDDKYGKDGEVPMEWTAILSTARKPNQADVSLSPIESTGC